MTSTSPAPHVGEIKENGVRLIVWIRRCQTDQVSNGAVGQVFIVGAQGRIRDGPLTEWIIYRLVVLPVKRIRCVVHANFEVLRTAEKEVAVVGKLSGIAPRVEVDDLVWFRTWDHILWRV